MKAFVLDRYKTKGALRFGDMPEPPVGDDDVLVAIQASGLNLLDSKIRGGEFKLILPYRPLFILRRS
jgi:NADPH:quinone reductase-like Zn-dependent oxidoreductase